MTTFEPAYLDQSTNRPAVPDGLSREVEYILAGHKGSDRAITRKDLLNQVRQSRNYRTVTDEQLRAAIGELRDRGRLICNDLSGNGYFWAGTLGEYQAFRAAYVAYAETIWKRARKMDQEAREKFDSEPMQNKLL